MILQKTTFCNLPTNEVSHTNIILGWASVLIYKYITHVRPNLQKMADECEQCKKCQFFQKRPKSMDLVPFGKPDTTEHGGLKL